jgi:hypothetical protein
MPSPGPLLGLIRCWAAGVSRPLFVHLLGLRLPLADAAANVAVTRAAVGAEAAGLLGRG